MRNILLLLSLIFTAHLAYGQGDPAPFIKGQSASGLGNQASTIFVPKNQSTKINAYQALIETGNSNVLVNPGFEGATITDCAAYDDGDVAMPVDGTGGTPTLVSIAAQTSTMGYGAKEGKITKLATSGRGEGIACSFTAPAGTTLRVRGKYTTSSGYLDYSTFPNSDIGIYVYDVTNSVLIPSAVSDVSANSGKGTYDKSFPLTAGSGTITGRILYHVQTSNTSAWTMILDERFAGESLSSRGPPVTDWKASTVATSITPATITSYERRVGDSLELTFIVTITSDTPSGSYLVTIPPAYVIDTTKYPSSSTSVPGHFAMAIGGTRYQGVLRYSGGGNFSMVVDNGASTPSLSDGVPADILNGTTIWGKLTTPIVGWTSNAAMSEDFSGIDATLKYTGNSGGALTADVTNISWSTYSTGASGYWDGDEFTAFQTDVYFFDGASRTTASVTGSIEAYIDGVSSTSQETTTGAVHYFDGFVKLRQGQKLSFRSTVSATQLNGAGSHYINITNRSSSQAIFSEDTNPAGTVITFAGTTCPTRYLNTDGTSYVKAEYARLYAAIGTTYGTASGTTFNVPDFRARFLRGADGGSGRDIGTRTFMNIGGATSSVGSIQADSTKRPTTALTGTISGTAASNGVHTHDIPTRTTGATANTGRLSEPPTGGAVGTVPTFSDGAHTHTVSGTATITGGGDAETRPINAAVLYCIKY